MTKYVSETIPYKKVLVNPIKYEGFIPEKESEVYISGIPYKATIEDLVEFCEQAGEIYQIKLMMTSKPNKNRGFGYVTYMNKSIAKKALNELQNKDFQDSISLTLELSHNNCRIFLGGLPKIKNKDEIWQALKNVYNVQNLVDVITYRSYSNPRLNRGFVFLEFYTHEEACYFRAKYRNHLYLFGKKLLVDWSIPIKECPNENLDQVKVLFLRNLPVSMGSEDFARLVYALNGKKSVERVFKYKDYAFVHLNTRTQAETLMTELKKNFCDTLVEVQFAKPGDKYTTRSYREKMLEQRRGNMLTKKNLTEYGTQKLEHDQKDWNKSASDGSVSPPVRSNPWSFGGNLTFGWFPFSMNSMSGTFLDSSTMSSDCSSSNLSSLNTTPNEDDDYFTTIDFEDMVTKLVEDD